LIPTGTRPAAGLAAAHRERPALVHACVRLFGLTPATYLDGGALVLAVASLATAALPSGTTLLACAIALVALAGWFATVGTRSAASTGPPIGLTPPLSGLLALGVLVESHFDARNAVGVALAAATIVAVAGRAIFALRESFATGTAMRILACTDTLTGLGNRRQLLLDLDDVFAGDDGLQRLFVVYDLNGFKRYNDTFGHPTGDALLARLAANLRLAVGGSGACYRLGGDEFCTLATVMTSEIGGFLDRATSALSETGEGFGVSTSFGCAILPEEAGDASEALRIADQRLYAQKYQLRVARGEPYTVLRQALGDRVGGVVELSRGLARQLGLAGEALEELGLAAQLHDVGKLAIPNSVLSKSEPLDHHELAFVRSHTLIGQRILDASPELNEVGKIVRATHEWWDGTGYPDGLAGDAIPLPARIIAVCDGFCAMTETRGYAELHTQAEALAELLRLSGSQYDPTVVDLFCALVRASDTRSREARPLALSANAQSRVR
jgi:diguanylate cyclase (GGDEF)-like protein